MRFGVIGHIVAVVVVEDGKFGKYLAAFGAGAVDGLLVDIPAADEDGVDAEIAEAEASLPEAVGVPENAADHGQLVVVLWLEPVPCQGKA